MGVGGYGMEATELGAIQELLYLSQGAEGALL